MTAWLALPFLPLSSMTRAAPPGRSGTEARRVPGEEAGIVDREGDVGVDAAPAQLGRCVHPGIEVLAAMAGRGVHEAGAGVVGDVIAGEHGDGVFIAAAETLEADAPA